MSNSLPKNIVFKQIFYLLRVKNDDFKILFKILPEFITINCNNDSFYNNLDTLKMFQKEKIPIFLDF